MATKKTTRSHKRVQAAPSTPKEIIAKYDCLQLHVKILTVLSGLIFLAVIVLGIVLVNCDYCRTPQKKATSATSSEIITEDEPVEAVEEE